MMGTGIEYEIFLNELNLVVLVFVGRALVDIGRQATIQPAGQSACLWHRCFKLQQ